VATGIMAGAWLGASLGPAGGISVMLRSILVGVFEAAGYAVIKEKIDRPEAFQTAGALIYLNFIFFWLTYQLVFPLQYIATISEKEWQETAPGRALVNKVIRIILGTEELKGQSTGIAVTVRVIQLLVPLFVLAWASWAIFGISPYAFFKSRVVH
jgi:hypothetical protein